MANNIWVARFVSLALVPVVTLALAAIRFTNHYEDPVQNYKNQTDRLVLTLIERIDRNHNPNQVRNNLSGWWLALSRVRLYEPIPKIAYYSFIMGSIPWMIAISIVFLEGRYFEMPEPLSGFSIIQVFVACSFPWVFAAALVIFVMFVFGRNPESKVERINNMVDDLQQT